MSDILWRFAQMAFVLLSSMMAGLPAYRVLRRFLPIGQRRWKRLAVWLTQSVAMFMVIWPGDENFLLTLPFYLAVLVFCSTGSLLSRVSLTVLFFSLDMSVSAFTNNLQRYGDLPDLLRTLLTIVVWVFIWLACRRLYPEDGTYPVLPPKLWGLIDLFCGLAFGALVATLVLPMSLSMEAFEWNVMLVDYIYWQVLLLSPIIAAAALGALIAIVVLSRQEQLQQAELLYEVNRAYYSQLEQSQQQVRRLRHDMANHLQALRALEGDALRDYLDTLADAPAFQSQRRFCESPVVNAVLQNKEPLWMAHGIKSEIAVTLPAGLCVSDVDLCALFANGLDNAIEACCRLPRMSRRLSVRARADKGLLVVRIRNRTADTAPLPKDSLPHSSKADRMHHGFGLQNIREIAARYQGSFEIQRAHGMFELFVTIPLASGKNPAENA